MIINLILIWTSWLSLILLGHFVGIATIMFIIFPIVMSFVVFGVHHFSPSYAWMASLMMSIPAYLIVIYSLIKDGLPKGKGKKVQKIKEKSGIFPMKDVYKIPLLNKDNEAEWFLNLIEKVEDECEGCYWLIDDDYESLEKPVKLYKNIDDLKKGLLSSQYEYWWFVVMAVPKEIKIDIESKNRYLKKSDFLVAESIVEFRTFDGDGIEIVTRNKSILNVLSKQ